MEENIRFTKLNGSGNDFIFVDNMDQSIDADKMIDFVRRVCRRGLSVGADGVMFIEPSERADFKWRFFNADGSEAEMCGNGGRCAVRFAKQHGIGSGDVSFETIAGVIDGSIEGSVVKLRMTEVFDFKAGLEVALKGRSVVLDCLNTGVPHAVEFVEDAEAVALVDDGRQIRYHEAFAPAGTNANFCQVTGPNSLILRTYERGVEDETLACGTGAVATAILAATRGLVEPPVEVCVRSDEILTIFFSGRGAEVADIYMQGETRLVYEGEMSEDAMRA
ncbi:MAG: diaminopimelate epimerase [Nitrospinaceae bacterium]|jgi:diaminopimelate epimerase|nr:diaminopimelate epimerase [Nitrospinaceae bacterium]MBT3433085.1 diaminopimelate epimerase [Nitrospinaceae bacterium]MBT3823102.1 diaminopimelate epimerase [Nitrospinaceae bacterium]MBT4094951.1 diaminopimelate epimerase [Nitrospinaceae bacterium]MBT4432037.1 diaminopimelate epimerase [Nitrospinaceae bacterium]